MKNLFYYKLDEAENIKKAYSSWIGKEAHIGRGQTETLKAIHLKPKRENKLQKSPVKVYRVEFEFMTKKKFSAIEFFFHNSLLPIDKNPFVKERSETGNSSS
jgi:hypothetical protein